jgi:hypothetical protein
MMRASTSRVSCVAEERGSVLIIFAFWLPVLLLIAMLSLEVGNWFEHKRHLQLQVDAAALAGGDNFAQCFGGAGNSALFDAADTYAGANGTFQGSGTQLTSPWLSWSPSSQPNVQIGGSSSGTVSVVYQSKTYPAGGVPADDTQTSGPCDPNGAYMFDVKASETNLPLFFGGLFRTLTGKSLVPVINAHARVQLEQVIAKTGVLPIAVPDPSPHFAFATFVDENNNGLPIIGCTTTTGVPVTNCTTPLTDSQTTDAGGLRLWSTSGTELRVPITSTNIGVRLRLVGGGDSTLQCGQLFVDCYDSGSTNGVVFIHGYSPISAAPALRNAWLLPGSCKTMVASGTGTPDAYFAGSACSAGTQVEVDLGSTIPLSGTGVTTKVSATANGTSIQLTRGSQISGTLYNWSAASGLPFSAGPNIVTYSWSFVQTSGTWLGQICKSTGSNPCKLSGQFSSGQRGFVATPNRSGPVGRVQVYQPLVSTSGADSFAVGTTQTLGVAIGVSGFLSNANVPGGSTQLVQLRIVKDNGGNGSQNQSIDCDPSQQNLRTELAKGCTPTYRIDSNPTVNCSTWPVNNSNWIPPSTFPQPWPCVAIQTGASVGQMSQGLQDRILGGSTSCTAPIHWPNFQPGDPRIVPLIVTPYGTFSGSGSGVVPVQDFGYFYVTGWGGNGQNSDPCPGADPAPTGDVVGHFIKYVDALDSSGATFGCDASLFAPCVPVLTK